MLRNEIYLGNKFHGPCHYLCMNTVGLVTVCKVPRRYDFLKWQKWRTPLPSALWADEKTSNVNWNYFKTLLNFKGYLYLKRQCCLIYLCKVCLSERHVRQQQSRGWWRKWTWCSWYAETMDWNTSLGRNTALGTFNKYKVYHGLKTCDNYPY